MPVYIAKVAPADATRRWKAMDDKAHSAEYLSAVRTNCSTLFFNLLFSLHLLNGLHAWFDWVPEIPRKYDFGALQMLLPNVRRVAGSWGFFYPTFFPSVIAFSFFMAYSRCTTANSAKCSSVASDSCM